MLVLLVTVVATGWAMIEALPLQELIDQADFIGIVEVVARRQLPPTGPKALPLIETTIKVVRPLKGTWKADIPPVFTYMGTLDGSMYIEDQPGFPAEGQQAIAFVRFEKNGRASCVNSIQGVWALHPETGAPQGMGLGKTLTDLEKAIADRAVPPVAR
ncbi:MAG: hypothetical protein OZSIB_2137 [Candidatus Ozemobacter sibiricus]|jgi:hypothetical protein|uniref:Uncharacterized protein n=1 Tax=Candidatus Ozemobacter sibiricus TaxID=2268124 RepID=A0A367ZT06_9BACT|nr:MAG: hypothetical protein OZSIB_2137 [Candidatus Ozemobacter sibiricus]